MSKLCRAARRVVVEVVVAKLDNWRRLFSGKAKFGRIRKNEFGRTQFLCLDSRDLPQLAKNDFPLKALVEAHEEVLSLGLNQFKLSRPYWTTFLYIHQNIYFKKNANILSFYIEKYQKYAKIKFDKKELYL